MADRPAAANVRAKEAAMNTVFLVIGIVFVVSVLALVAYSLFELTPLATHKDHYRTADGARRFTSPRLD
jgi:hypothetical protein